MGEWKRILSNPRRLALLLAIPLICIGLFLYDCTGSIQLSSWQEMIENNQFYQGLVREMQDYSLEEAQTYLTEQSDLLSDVVLWTWGWALEDKTAEEVAEMLAAVSDRLSGISGADSDAGGDTISDDDFWRSEQFLLSKSAENGRRISDHTGCDGRDGQ